MPKRQFEKMYTRYIEFGLPPNTQKITNEDMVFIGNCLGAAFGPELLSPENKEYLWYGIAKGIAE